MLASGVPPAERHPAGKRFGLAILLGLSAALCLLLALFGIRSDMPQMLGTPLFWVKSAFPLVVAAAALFVAGRLARPGASTVVGWLALGLPLLAVWLATAFVIGATPPALRLALVLGSSWRVCTLSIMLLSIPTFVAVFWAMRGLAPTRLTLAGAGAGLLAGAQAVLVYTLYCSEMAVPFWGIWYVLGMLVTASLGALLGPRLLRW
jgi:hypothetical protein